MVHDPTKETLFPTLPPEILEQLQQLGQVREFADGEQILQEGTVDYPFSAVLEGEVRVSKQIGPDRQLLAVHGPRHFIGEISMLAGAPSVASAYAAGPVKVISIPVAALRTIASESVRKTILTAMTLRSQEVSGFIVQQEKLAALGKLSAGLAHELNNPASAASRANSVLKEAIGNVQTLSMQYDCRFTSEQRDHVLALQRSLLQQLPGLNPLDSMDRSDREEVFSARLQSHGVDRGWDAASVLVGSGMTLGQLDDLAAVLDSKLLPAAVTWLEATLQMMDLSMEVETSLARISDLVGAMKEYSYMDQAAFQKIDIHKGIESTLKMFSPRLKGGVEVVRDYDRGLPRIFAFASELNQVWTNLIANALDAMDGTGRLTIRTARSDDGVTVEVGDTGPGIPPAIQPRIFEPFFTTKTMGSGTGLGLDISYRVVTLRHGGSITVTSQPGDTRFQVSLPLTPPKEKI